MPPHDERLDELINLTLDGQATVGEQDELRLMLVDSPEARELESSTRQVFARLEAMPSVPPPTTLRPAVMERVHQTGLVIPGPGVWRRRRFAMAWAAAAALVLVFLIIDRPARVGEELGGVMAPAAAWPVAATLESQGDSVVIRNKDDLFLVEPRISGPYPVTAEISWKPGDAVLVAVTDGPDTSSAAEKARFTVRSASDRPTLMLRSLSGEPFEIELAVAGTEVLRIELPLGGTS